MSLGDSDVGGMLCPECHGHEVHNDDCSQKVERCRSCNAQVIWAKTAGGKSMPVDLVPTEDGNIVLSMQNGGPVAIVQSKDQIETLHRQAAVTGQPHLLFRSHFVTCPQSQKWRKK